MSEGTRRIDPRWHPPIAASATLVLLVIVLGIQHARHGWPFSLHHGLAPASPPERAASAEHEARREAEREGDVPGAARSAVERSDATRLEALGVVFEPVRFEELGSEVRAVATVVPDEARLEHVHTRVSGWIREACTCGRPACRFARASRSPPSSRASCSRRRPST